MIRRSKFSVSPACHNQVTWLATAAQQLTLLAVARSKQLCQAPRPWHHNATSWQRHLQNITDFRNLELDTLTYHVTTQFYYHPQWWYPANAVVVVVVLYVSPILVCSAKCALVVEAGAGWGLPMWRGLPVYIERERPWALSRVSSLGVLVLVITGIEQIRRCQQCRGRIIPRSAATPLVKWAHSNWLWKLSSMTALPKTCQNSLKYHLHILWRELHRKALISKRLIP